MTVIGVSRDPLVKICFDLGLSIKLKCKFDLIKSGYSIIVPEFNPQVFSVEELK